MYEFNTTARIHKFEHIYVYNRFCISVLSIMEYGHGQLFSSRSFNIMTHENKLLSAQDDVCFEVCLALVKTTYFQPNY